MDALPNRLLVTVEDRRRILREVDRKGRGVRRERESRAIAQDARSRPPTHQRIHQSAGAAQEPLASPDRQVIHIVGADDVPRIEQRVRPARPQVRQVADQSLPAERKLVRIVRDVRLIVDRMRERIIEVDQQVVRVALAYAHQQSVIRRRCVVSDVTIRSSLRIEPHVGIQDPIPRKLQDRTGKVTHGHKLPKNLATTPVHVGQSGARETRLPTVDFRTMAVP